MPKGVYIRKDIVRRNMSLARKGIKPSPEAIKIRSDGLKRAWKEGKFNKRKQIPWNKGKHYKNPKNSYAKKEWYKTHKHPKGMLGKPAWNRGLHPSEGTRKKLSEAVKINWQNKELAGKMRKASTMKPNNEELYLDAILQLNFPHEWKFVGDNQILIESRNPDFINCNGKKLIIEYNGFFPGPRYDFGHTIEKDNAKAEIYAKYGYRTLNLYSRDLKDTDILLEKINNFAVI